MKLLPVCAAVLAYCPAALAADQILVESESFKAPGGWVLDTQFIEIMGSPYLMAHGMGQPVKDAATTVKVQSTGTYRVWVRTKDWVARWKAPGQPGRFQVLIDGKPLAETFGTKTAEWAWQDGGPVELSSTEFTLGLRDLTGFNGRCDAIFLTKDTGSTPPNDVETLPKWRQEQLGLPAKPADAGNYDLVVCGGGYGGMGAAISAARMGLRVALIQNRPVLGGNGSSEVRVWAMGGIRRGLYPNLGEIVEEFQDQAKESPGKAEEFGDDKKERVISAEKNISLFLNNHVIGVEMRDPQTIEAVVALDTRTSERRRFAGKFFVDSTGHAYVGEMAGAVSTLRETEHLGMSNMWRWADAGAPQAFPQTPWALNMEMEDFPYPQRFHAQWFWESGFNVHPIYGLEETRDWNLRAIYGAFDAMKNKGGKGQHVNAKLEWVAYVGGTRESRQLMGDVLLTRDDITEKRAFPDGTVPTTWDIDLHYPKEQYAKKFAENPFISKAVFDKRVDRKHGFPIPYRCFYSKNVENLFMAGRNISVTHEALGTVRVMKTGGMIGEVVGKAASVCVKNQCTPRAVSERYFGELKELLALPGAARRETVTSPVRLPEGYQPLPPPSDLKAEAEKVIPADRLKGLVIDDAQAKLTGSWTEGEGLSGFVGSGYRYRGAKDMGAARFEFKVDKAGTYEVRLSYGPHENRATNTPVVVESAQGSKSTTVNQKVTPPVDKHFISLGNFRFEPGKPAVVTVGGSATDGHVHADAVQLLPVQ